MTNPDTLIPAAHITGAHGLRGQLRAQCLLADISLLKGTVPTRNRAGENGPFLTITHLQPQPSGTLLLTVAEATSRTAAESLKGLTILLSRCSLPALGTDEVYLHDLLGRTVTLPDGTATGTVTALKNTGAQDLLEVTTPVGGTVLIPVHPDFFEDMTANPLKLSDLGTQLLTL